MSDQPTQSDPVVAGCLSCDCGDDGFPRRRGICNACYSRAWQHGIADQYPACGAVAVPYYSYDGEYMGLPDDYIPAPTGWPLVPALLAPLHPPLPAATRWGQVVWYSRPQHDPIGQALCDRETRYVQVEAA